MKQSKRILSVFLAVLLLFGSFGAVSASAMSNEDAETAVAEFNANIPDHSSIYTEKSAKEWKSTMNDLNKAVAAIVEKADLAGTIYSDATLNALIPTLLTLIPESTMLIGSYMKVPATVKFFEENGLHPEVTEYLKTIDTWADFDGSQAVWGITDRESFATALGDLLAPTFGALMIVISGLAPDVYNGLLVPVLESLNPEPFKDATSFTAGSTSKDCRPMGHYFANYLCDAIDLFLANPVKYLCSVLPDFAKSFGEAMYYTKNTKNLLTMAIDVSILPDDFNGLVVAINEGLKGSDINLTLPEIDNNFLMTMGTAVVAESGRGVGPKDKVASYAVEVVADKPMVFAAVAQYVQEVLQNKDNQVEIGRVIAEKTGGYGEEYMAVVDAAANGSSLDVAIAVLDFAQAVNKDKAEDANPIVAFFAKIAAFFNDLAKKILKLFK